MSCTALGLELFLQSGGHIPTGRAVFDAEALEARQVSEPFGHSSNLERRPFNFASLCIQLLLQSPLERQTVTTAQIQLFEIRQLSKPFGEWRVRQEQKIRVNLLGAIPFCTAAS